MLIGTALIPRLDIADRPRPRQGKTLTVSYGWHGASAKVIEQNVTSRIEGLVSSIKGVESVSSVSYFGSGHVTIHLKKEASVSSVKFEIASLLRQVRDKFPQGVSYPVLSGGEVITSKSADERGKPLLTYLIQADMAGLNIRQKVERELKPRIEREEGVSRVDVTGGTDFYLQVSYDAVQLSQYGITAADLEGAIRNELGREDIVGEVMHENVGGEKARMSVFLSIDADALHLESTPVKSVNGKIIYLNNLADCEYKEKEPDSYYRINGMNTVYMNVFAEEDANISRLASRVKSVVEEEYKQPKAEIVMLTLIYDRSVEQLSAFQTLVIRSGMSLLFLLLFVYFIRKDWKYLCIIAVALLANILVSVILYWLFDLRIHPFSMAGITVSLGLIIDSTIVMVDHYSYYRNHGAFHGILGAMLTTIGSIIIIIWLPDYLKNDLYDFSWIIIINLMVALLVSAFFVPALVSRLNYTSHQRGKIRHMKYVRRWTSIYIHYVRICQHRICRWLLLLGVAGAFVVSLYLFSDTLDSNVYRPEPEEMKLSIRGQMPLGGTAKQLNEKVEEVETFLSQFHEIKRYETNVAAWGASIVVEFKPEHLYTGFPYLLENKVIGKLITIGGADWSTYGVSDRGFSNSLNLQHRSYSIEIAGYDYDRLYRFAEDICRKLNSNSRVTDIAIETPGHENQEDELYMEYDRKHLAYDSVNVASVHGALSSLLSERHLGKQKRGGLRADMILHPKQNEDFDLWQLENAHIKVEGNDIKVSDFMLINRRKAKNCIPRDNQEYILRVAFNVLGSYTYTSKYIKQVTDEFNAKFPVGFRCLNRSYGWYEDDGTQYWLIGLVVVIIFFVCAILFESLYQALVIILLIPVSLIGMFLTYHYSGTEFGTGGFAAMVMLCGLTVNAGIYLMNEYNHTAERHDGIKRFVKAYNHKIIPILLTVVSTIIGLIPFLMDGAEERFWFSFSVGSISGLLFSLVALILVMPMLMNSSVHRHKTMIPTSK